jgi:hypothetical protein
MKKTNKYTNNSLGVTDQELAALLHCGRYSAVRLSMEAKARKKIGSRIINYLPKIEEFLQESEG